MIIGIVIGSLVVILVAIVVIWFYFRKKSENMKFKFQMEQVGKNNMNRYIDFPIMAAKYEKHFYELITN